MHHRASKQKQTRNIVMWFCSPISDCLYGLLGHLWEYLNFFSTLTYFMVLGISQGDRDAVLLHFLI